MKILKLILLGTLSFTILNCSSAEKEDLTKTEVEKRKTDGDTTDYCEEFGWYDDGVCDTICIKEDPECAVNCLAEPICEQGYLQIESCRDVGNLPDGGSSDAAPIFNDCKEVTVCGTTISCQFDEITCAAIAPACPDGSVVIVGECPADASCTVFDDGCTRVTCMEENQLCGGQDAETCAADQFCKYGPADICGHADAPGICEIKPTECAEIFAPVCGCDGQTYGNDCDAHAAGISVASTGECATVCQSDNDCLDDQNCVAGACQEQTICGGFGGQTCANDEYCEYPFEAFCGAADGTGVCRLKPDACAFVDAPVCGCDGQTYASGCEANIAGTAVADEGECPIACNSNSDCQDTEACVNGICAPTKVVCGGNSPNPGQCGADEFCLIAPQDLCGAADAPGVCTTQPMICTAIYSPVCGCDNVTYGNKCTAWANGVSVATPGVCAP